MGLKKLIGECDYCLKCKKQLQMTDKLPLFVHGITLSLLSFCLQCKYELPFIHKVMCKKCGAYRTCYNNCEEMNDLKQNFSSIIYTDDVKEWIRLFKFDGKIDIGEALRPMISIAVQRYKIVTNEHQTHQQKGIMGLFSYGGSTSNCNIVTSVPISQQRLLERGFNQATYFAKLVSKQLDAPFVSLLERKNDFDHNSHLGKLDRAKVMKEKFFCNISALNNLNAIKHKVTNKQLNIIIVDDIYTTGQTLSACARVLKARLGENINVYGITLARA